MQQQYWEKSTWGTETEWEIDALFIRLQSSS